ncbi:hypothetical protein GOBAR_DD00420 [Gossypium barbadense]|nr:hypothetical protein GOBAR_DD00420 [Gossypium barbadense]
MFASINKYISDLSKLEPLDGTNTRRWPQRMVIFFEQLEVDLVLFNPPITKEPRDSVIVPKDSDVDATRIKFEKEKNGQRSHVKPHG